MTGRADEFLARWSRRKRSSNAPEVAADNMEATDPAGAAIPDDAEIPEDAEADQLLLEEMGLKNPDELMPGDDFGAYLKASLPAHLKRRAMRKLWVSNPILANLDGLNDYDGDFTGGGVAPGELRTAYQVGRGFIRDLLTNEDAAEGGAEPVVQAEVPDLPDVSDQPEVEAASEIVGEIHQDQDQSSACPVRRPMAFKFRDNG